MPDIINEFLAAAPEERVRMALDAGRAGDLRAYMGEAAFEEYAAVARGAVGAMDDVSHLGVGAPKNLLFVPGVMGSLLMSQGYGGMWWIDARTRHHLNDLRLDPSGETDADENAQVAPITTDPVYEPFMSAVLKRDDFGHVMFAYDWRKSLRRSAARLRDEILRLHQGNGGLPIHLVAHSMGGLMVRAALMEHGDEIWPKIGRIVFVGTPHYGSPAIAGYLKNHFWGFDLMAVLGMYLDRDAYRSMYGVMELLPAPVGVYPGTDATTPACDHPCANFDMYSAGNWKLDLDAGKTADLQRVLDSARRFHEDMERHHQALDQERRDRMAVIAGVGYKALFRLEYRSGLLGLWENMDKECDRIHGNAHRDGDGRVPLASAELHYVGETRYVRGVHGGLTNIPAVYEDVFRFLNAESMKLPANPANALSAHLADSDASEAPHLDGSARADAWSDDPGYWNEAALPDDALTALDARLDSDQLPAFNTVRLL